MLCEFIWVKLMLFTNNYRTTESIGVVNSPLNDSIFNFSSNNGGNFPDDVEYWVDEINAYWVDEDSNNWINFL